MSADRAAAAGPAGRTRTTQDSLLQLTQLRQLTLLTYGAWPAGEDWLRYHCFEKVGKGP